MKLPKGLSFKKDVGHLDVGQLYSTIVVANDGYAYKVRLNRGGWNTKHTKKCINLVLDKLNIPLCIKQVNFNWYVVNTDNGIVRPCQGRCVLPPTKIIAADVDSCRAQESLPNQLQELGAG